MVASKIKPTDIPIASRVLSGIVFYLLGTLLGVSILWAIIKVVTSIMSML